MNAITIDATSPTVRYGMSAGEFRRVTAIFSSVIAATGVSKESIFGRRRTARVAHARQLAMTLIRESTDLSLMEVGDIFGRDHGTVIHAIRAVAARRAAEGEFDALYLDLIAQAKA